MTLDSSNDTVAILYDIENSPFEMLNFTLEKAERYQPCRIIVVSDWDARPEQKRWEKLMRRPGFTFRQISRTFFGKNSLDSALCDSAQLLYQEGVRKFFIITTDSDFVHIAELLNMDTPSYIIGVGTKQASESLRSAYNEFFVYPPEEDMKKSPKNPKALAEEKAEPVKKSKEKAPKEKENKEKAKEKLVKENAAKKKTVKKQPEKAETMQKEKEAAKGATKAAVKDKVAKAAETKAEKTAAETAAPAPNRQETQPHTLSVRLPKSLRMALEERRLEEGVTLDELVTYLLMRGLR